MHFDFEHLSTATCKINALLSQWEVALAAGKQSKGKGKGKYDSFGRAGLHGPADMTAIKVGGPIPPPPPPPPMLSESATSVSRSGGSSSCSNSCNISNCCNNIEASEVSSGIFGPIDIAALETSDSGYDLLSALFLHFNGKVPSCSKEAPVWARELEHAVRLKIGELEDFEQELDALLSRTASSRTRRKKKRGK